MQKCLWRGALFLGVLLVSVTCIKKDEEKTSKKKSMASILSAERDDLKKFKDQFPVFYAFTEYLKNHELTTETISPPKKIDKIPVKKTNIKELNEMVRNIRDINFIGWLEDEAKKLNNLYELIEKHKNGEDRSKEIEEFMTKDVEGYFDIVKAILIASKPVIDDKREEVKEAVKLITTDLMKTDDMLAEAIYVTTTEEKGAELIQILFKEYYTRLTNYSQDIPTLLLNLNKGGDQDLLGKQYNTYKDKLLHMYRERLDTDVTQLLKEVNAYREITQDMLAFFKNFSYTESQSNLLKLGIFSKLFKKVRKVVDFVAPLCAKVCHAFPGVGTALATASQAYTVGRGAYTAYKMQRAQKKAEEAVNSQVASVEGDREYGVYDKTYQIAVDERNVACGGCLGTHSTCQKACERSGFKTGSCPNPGSTDPGRCCACKGSASATSRATNSIQLNLNNTHQSGVQNKQTGIDTLINRLLDALSGNPDAQARLITRLKKPASMTLTSNDTQPFAWDSGDVIELFRTVNDDSVASFLVSFLHIAAAQKYVVKTAPNLRVPQLDILFDEEKVKADIGKILDSGEVVGLATPELEKEQNTKYDNIVPAFLNLGYIMHKSCFEIPKVKFDSTSMKNCMEGYYKISGYEANVQLISDITMEKLQEIAEEGRPFILQVDWLRKQINASKTDLEWAVDGSEYLSVYGFQKTSKKTHSGILMIVKPEHNYPISLTDGSKLYYEYQEVIKDKAHPEYHASILGLEGMITKAMIKQIITIKLP